MIRAASAVQAPPVPLLIGGRWMEGPAAAFFPVHNPSTGEAIAAAPDCGEAEVDAAVQAAEAALPGWAATPPFERARVLFRYQALLRENLDGLADLVCRENGKTFPEAKGSVQRGLEVVEFACGAPHLLKGESLADLSPRMDAHTILQPVGVCAGVTPFNFPAMIPLWMFPIAVACGNAFILKPSERVPLTAVRLLELLVEAGIPPGVVNLVHGGRRAVEAILAHPGIHAVSFVGSSNVARRIYATAAANGKRVQAAGGAKNVMVVLPDADLALATGAVIGSAFGCAGQRCMAGSVLVAVGREGDQAVESVRAAADRLEVGRTDVNREAGMGPVVSPEAKNRVLDAIARGVAEGAELARDGRKGVPENGFFVGPTLFDRATPGMSIAKDEIFGPVLATIRARDADEAVALANLSPYGNGATVFTQDGGAAREFAERIRCGMVGVNVGVPAPMAVFPFTGWNESFFGDLHLQGTEGVRFYTRQKVVLARWAEGKKTAGWT